MSSKPRAIFEEVGDAAPRPSAAPSPGAADEKRRRDRRFAAGWLMVLAAMVALMVVIGGLTRLTDSGLSITEWKPVAGALPPMSDAAWQAEFDKYRASPEYQLQNKGMELAAFKEIYWWEWGHRQLGRLVGLVWAAGFAWMLFRRAIPPGWTGRLILPGALGAVQGALGWWMVASGLTGRMVDVASYRLAMHLGLAFVILGVIAWFVMELRRDPADLLQARRRRIAGAAAPTRAFLALIFAQVLLGALVAGIDAGRGYIDWPLMGGEFLPSESFAYAPLWSNFFENPALVQFNHRMLGYAVFAFGLFWAWKLRRAGHGGLARAAGWAALMLVAQMALGIVTVMNAAPLGWAIAHQIGAIALWTLVLRALFLAAFPPRERIAGA